MNRLVHIPSGRNYNKITNPPKVEGLDDITGEPLEQRVEDTLEAHHDRILAFHSVTDWALEYYKREPSILINIDANHTIN